MEYDTILVVDDEEDICSELNIFLSKQKFRVLTALNGEDAMELFRIYSPAVTVTDYRMPKMDGLELLQQIKGTAPQAEVIFISGHADMRTAVQAIQKHAFDFLSKPIDLDELHAKVKAALERVRNNELNHSTYRGTALTHERYEVPHDASILFLLTPLDSNQRQRTMQEFQKLTEQRKLGPAVIVSLGSVEYINNVGLNTLLDIQKELQNDGKRVLLTQLSPRVYQYLKTLGYHETFQITQNVESALALL